MSVVSHTFTATSSSAVVSLSGHPVDDIDSCPVPPGVYNLGGDCGTNPCAGSPGIHALTLEEDVAVQSKDTCNCAVNYALEQMLVPPCTADCGGTHAICQSDCVKLEAACRDLTDGSVDFIETILPGGVYRFIYENLVTWPTIEAMDSIFQAVFLDKCAGTPANSSSSPTAAVVGPEGSCLPVTFSGEDLAGEPGACSLSTWQGWANDVAEVDDYNAEVDAENAERRARSKSTSKVHAAQPTESQFSARRVFLASLILVLYAFFVGEEVVCKRAPALQKVEPVLSDEARNELKKASMTLRTQTDFKAISAYPDLASAVQAVDYNETVAANLQLSELMGVVGAFAFFVLLVMGVIALSVGHVLECPSLREGDKGDENGCRETMTPTSAVVMFYATSFVSAVYFVDSVIFYKETVTKIEVELRGLYDPLAALKAFPPVHRLARWYFNNFALNTAGKYSILLVLGSEIFELMVQGSNANALATWLTWTEDASLTGSFKLRFYCQLICANFVTAGILTVLPERYSSTSLVAAADVLFDTAYIFFNLFNKDLTQFGSIFDFLSILFPLYLMIEMANDCFLYHLRTTTAHYLRHQLADSVYRAAAAEVDDEKYKNTMAKDFLRSLGKLSDDTKEVPNFDIMAPTVSFDESEEAAVVQTATRLFLPCTPRQALTFQAMFSMHHEEGDSVTLHQVETKSVGHHVRRLEFDLPKFMARDGLIDQVFMPVGSNGEAFLAMLRSTTHPACPKKAGVTRVVLPIQGFFFQAGTNSDGVSGTMVTCTSCMDPLGWVPKWYVNSRAKGQAMDRFEQYHDYFVKKKDLDGSDLGDWPEELALSLEREHVQAKERRGSVGSVKLLAPLRTAEGGAGDEATEEDEDVLSDMLKAVLAGNSKSHARFLHRIRLVVGCIFLVFGLFFFIVSYALAKSQESACEAEFSECVWGAIGEGSAHLYFANGFGAGGVCGFGSPLTALQTGKDFKLDVSSCVQQDEWDKLVGLGEKYKSQFEDLLEFKSENTGWEELPEWLNSTDALESMRKFEMRGNRLPTFPAWLNADQPDALELVDLRDNAIESLPYDVMNAGGNFSLLFDGNPCASRVDWSGLGVDRLPPRMNRGGGNGTSMTGGFSDTLRVLVLNDNQLTEGMWGGLAGYSNLTKVEVARNEITGFEGIGGLLKLEELVVDGNEQLEMEGVAKLVQLAGGSELPRLETLSARGCKFSTMNTTDASVLQDFDVDLGGNDIVELDFYNECVGSVGQRLSIDLRRIPRFMRTLEKLERLSINGYLVGEISEGDLPGGVRQLKIAHTDVGESLVLGDRCFRGLYELKALNLQGNALVADSFYHGMWEDVAGLERLVLTGNDNLWYDQVTHQSLVANITGLANLAKFFPARVDACAPFLALGMDADACWGCTTGEEFEDFWETQTAQTKADLCCQNPEWKSKWDDAEGVATAKKYPFCDAPHLGDIHLYPSCDAQVYESSWEGSLQRTCPGVWD